MEGKTRTNGEIGQCKSNDFFPPDHECKHALDGEQQQKELFDAKILQNFSFSPFLTLNTPTKCFMGNTNKLPSLVLDEPLIPIDHLIQMFNTQDEVGNNLGPNRNANVSIKGTNVMMNTRVI